MTTPRRIGLLDLSAPGCESVGTYSRMLALSLGQAAAGKDTDVVFVTDRLGSVPQGTVHVADARSAAAGFSSAMHRVRTGLTYRMCRVTRGRYVSSPAWWTAIGKSVDLLLPITWFPAWACGIPLVGWIPDFQHLHLPDCFTAHDCRHRDEVYLAMAERCKRIMLSSHDVLADYRRFAPRFSHKASVHPFPSLFAFERPTGDPALATAAYQLPPRFALVVNQFWAHKNHLVVVRALSLLRQRGKRPCVVFAGLPADFRDPTNATLSIVLQEIARHRLQDQLVLLGRVSFPELVSLLRSCALLIQPSRFEGWNTSVEDAKALGRPIACSDIGVHKEQAPSALGFFDVDDPAQLAELLDRHWEELQPGPNIAKEQEALDRGCAFAREHGTRLLEMCWQVIEEAG